MLRRKKILTVIIIAVLNVAAILISACAPTGVSQSDLDKVKQQLAAQEQKATALQQQLSSKDKDLTDAQQKLAEAQKKPAGDPSITTLIGVKPVPQKPTPTPVPAGFIAPPAPPPPQPPAAKNVALYAHIDTVTSGPGESQYNLDGIVSCVKTGIFKRGMHLVWRMEIVDTTTGKVLQGADVKDATLRLPTGQEMKFRYGRHGPTEDAPWFWTTAWDIPPDYPPGVLDYSVTITTNDGKSVKVSDPLAMKLPDRGMDTRVTIVP